MVLSKQTLPPGACELGSSNDEIERNFFEEALITENNAFLIEPNFSTTGCIKKFSRQEPLISFVQNYSIGELPGFFRF